MVGEGPPDQAVNDLVLGLLARMRATERVAEVLARLGAGEGELEQARHARLRHSIDDYVRALGDALSVEPEPGLDPNDMFGGSLRHRFPAPYWPGFDLLVRTHPDGFTWGPEFVRAAGSGPPAVGRIAELTPWSITDFEVQQLFGPHDSEIGWEHGRDAIRNDLTLEFDFGLLQAVYATP